MPGGKAPRAAGDRFERACAIRLRKAGYLVIRSAGSLGPADLVAFREDRIATFVQCKITDNMTAQARADFYRVAFDAGAMAVLATRPIPRGGVHWLRLTNDGG